MFERLRIRKARIAAQVYQNLWHEGDHIGGIANRVLSRLVGINWSAGEHPLEVTERAVKALRELELECKALRKQLADARVWPERARFNAEPWPFVTVMTVLGLRYLDPTFGKEGAIHKLLMTDLSRLNSPGGYWMKQEWFIKEMAESERGPKYRAIMKEWQADHAGS